MPIGVVEFGAVFPCQSWRPPAMTSPSDRKGRPKPSAYEKALGLLARREHSARELKRKLDHGGYESEATSEALNRLGEQQYQDDGRFGQQLLRSRVAQGYGPMYIRVELRSHGLADAAIRDLLEHAEVDWTALAQNQLRRHYGVRPAVDPVERQRRAQYLLRRGFSAATIRVASRVELDEVDHED